MPAALRVLLPLPVEPYSFAPPHGAPEIAVGTRVAVPWQNAVRIGIVTAVEGVRGEALELREAIGPLDDRPFLTPQALRTIERIAQHCLCPQGTVLAALLPTGLGDELVHELRALSNDLAGVPTDGWTAADRLEPKDLELYRRQGLVLERARVRERTVRVLAFARDADEGLEGAARENQRRALERLRQVGSFASGAELARDAGVPDGAVRALVTKGYARYAEVAAPLPPLPAFPPSEALPEPAVVVPDDTLSLSGGSRLERLASIAPLLERDVRGGGNALVLVPEAAFLAETASALASRVPVRTLSGELTDAQRERAWRELQDERGVVLVGTFLALLAPLEEVRRVVVLEEASPSYKLSSGPRLFVPSGARLLAEEYGVTALFADVVPAPETRRLAGERSVSIPSPRVRLHVADLGSGSGWPLHADMVKVLRQVAERGRQAVLLAPRRGFSAALECADCRWVRMCPNCDLPLRFHRVEHRLRCHQCGHVEGVPEVCPQCGGVDLGPSRTAGTQWVVRAVEEAISGAGEGVPVVRYDSDQRTDLGPFLAGRAGIVVTTSAIFRQPALPNVALVGVTLLDSLLAVGDFRAEEEAVRLLLNLPELAPGGRPLVVVQAFDVEARPLALLHGGDVRAYVDGVLERRERFGYPPFSQLARIQVSARQAGVAEREAHWIVGAARAAGARDEEVLGPSAGTLTRVRNQHVFGVLVRTVARERLERLVEPAVRYRGPARVRVDVEPREIGGFLE